jgi:tetratricopeptide (TPR) repeat protein
MARMNPPSTHQTSPPKTLFQEIIILYAKRVRLFFAVVSLSLLSLFATALIIKIVSEPNTSILFRSALIIVLGVFVGLAVILAERRILVRQAHAQREDQIVIGYDRAHFQPALSGSGAEKSMQVQVVVSEEAQRILQGQLDALKERPDNVELLRGIGSTLTVLGRYDEAYHVYLRAHNLQPDDELTNSKITMLGDLAQISHWREWPPKEQLAVSDLPSEAQGVKST